MKGAAKILLIFIVVVVVVLVGYALFQSRTEIPPTNGGTLQEAKTFEVVYNGTAYSPQTLTIKVGDTVKFVNRSATDMWPASAMHPTHKAYPTTGGCIGSTFDACKDLKPGESWSFKFDIGGSWKYHDHLNPATFGTVVVKQIK